MTSAAQAQQLVSGGFSFLWCPLDGAGVLARYAGKPWLEPYHWQCNNFFLIDK
jgi:hypothetical protein